MNHEQSIFDLIENYHLGLLSKEEREQVESRMRTDAGFAEYVKFNGFANEIVQASGLDRLRDQMNTDLKKIEHERVIRKWKIAAGIIGVLVGLAVLFYYTKRVNNGKIIIPDHHKQNKNTTEQIFPAYRSNKENSHTVHTNKKSSISSSILTPGKEIKQESDQTIIPPVANTDRQTDNIVPDTEVIAKEEKSSKKCIISFDATLQLSCKGERNGSIVIQQDDISGGKAPYSFHIAEVGQQSETGIFSDLSKGKYTITITDANKCSTSKEITLHEKDCITKKTFSFNPDYGEKWQMEMSQEKSGSFTIYNRGGIIIRSNNFLAGSSIEWDGTNTLGAFVDMGIYMCTIHYADGKTDVIELSIVR